ncbi:TIGR01777 family oxidoreductase [Planococcus maitriensis]|uniref:TIGR01777 family protein n=1 Tax=Planococcus maitriensis TaxID=221799 RepID=A0A365K3U8_9BACL|nr:TIGR01777 family oxidoreductase [Planococcus maitriensis]RAZ67309.1 TIGR01777 family protein [Planococcus maitriensis]
MVKKAVIAGGTGFIGMYLKEKYERLGYRVHIISRQSGHIQWDDACAMKDALDGAKLVINLAGKSVNCRYTEANKREIFNSRTETTETLGRMIEACSTAPELWVNASTATIYRHAEDRPMTERNGEIGRGFSVAVAKAWEDSFFSFHLPDTRQVALRIAIVLGDGGVMEPYRKLVKYGLGGKQGSGRQMFSWIHIEDLYRTVRFMQHRDELSGVFNASAPNPVTNQEWMKMLRQSMNRRGGLPASKWMLETGAAALRTETELILKSRWAVPERLVREGFRFRYPGLRSALADLNN